MRKFEFWTVAYRTKQEKLLSADETERKFKVIKNTWRYWCADPHLFDYNGNTYVFAELYDRVLRRGVIGYCKITENGYTPWKVVLKMPWHLSYPHVFTYENAIYMMPESYVAKEIAVYKAEKFPENWEKVAVLKRDYVAVDSTLFSVDNLKWLQTLQFADGHEYFNLFAVNKGGLSDFPLIISKDDMNKRPGGKLFVYKGKLIRPAQDCAESYGCALNFYEVIKAAKNVYEEILIAKLGHLIFILILKEFLKEYILIIKVKSMRLLI